MGNTAQMLGPDIWRVFVIPRQCRAPLTRHPGTAGGSSNDVMSCPGLKFHGFRARELSPTALSRERNRSAKPCSRARQTFYFFFFFFAPQTSTQKDDDASGRAKVQVHARSCVPSAFSDAAPYILLCHFQPCVSVRVLDLNLGCVPDRTVGPPAHISPTRRALIRPREREGLQDCGARYLFCRGVEARLHSS